MMIKIISGIAILIFSVCGSCPGQRAVVYTTAKGSDLHLRPTDTLYFKELGQPPETVTCVFVDPTGRRFQTLLGIGGALTDASAETFARLPAARQEELLTKYYDPKAGIGYTLARTNMNSCDFSSSSYTYVDDMDKELKTFSIAHDLRFRIPLIKRAMAAAGGRLTLFSSPWSPPAWMKDNHQMAHGGRLKPEFYQAWADYYVEFIKAYAREGVSIWGTTIQNEPMASQTWESCLYTATEERDFLKGYLGPTFEKEGLGDKKIIVWDHNRDLIYQRASVLFNDSAAARYAWGIAFHWYEDWSGGSQMYDNVERVHESFPGKNLLFSEGCNGPFASDSIRNWSNGEQYGRSMINDFNNGTVGWTDWNILLDEKGGPNHVGNFCFAPVHADTRTGELIYTPAFDYIGHFSKFIRPGARRITSVSSRSPLLTTAFLNPDGRIAVIVMNQTDQPIPYELWVAGKGAMLKARPHSIVTWVW